MPLLFGAGFCVLQIVLSLARFGFPGRAGEPAGSPGALVGMLLGSELFFVAGTLAGLFATRLVRGARGEWMKFLIVAIFLATPIAMASSLEGGLLGPPFVVAFAVIPYLLLAGVPALARSASLRARTRGSQIEPPTG